PAQPHGDKGYDYPSCRRLLRRRGITPRIARRGVESTTRLGRHRWKAERSLARLLANRRLVVRYERRADILTAFLPLACPLDPRPQAPIAVNHFEATASPRLRSSDGCLGARGVRSVVGLTGPGRQCSPWRSPVLSVPGGRLPPCGTRSTFPTSGSSRPPRCWAVCPAGLRRLAGTRCWSGTTWSSRRTCAENWPTPGSCSLPPPWQPDGSGSATRSRTW